MDRRILEIRLAAAGIDPKKATNEQIKAHQIPSWVLHDLRRTMVTCMNDAFDVPPLIVEAVVNHVAGDAKKGAAGVYNHAKYNRQKLQALEQWTRHLGELVSDEERRVVPMRA